jgi:predicted transcriptional regulator
MRGRKTIAPKVVNLVVRITEEQRKWLDELVEKEDRTKSQIIRRILKEYVEIKEANNE